MSTNTFSGPLTINNGFLAARASGALGASAGGTTVNDPGTLALNSFAVISGESLTLNGTSGYSIFGPLYVNGGSNTWAGPVTLNTNATVKVLATCALNIIGTVSGPGGFTKVGPGTLTLSGTTNNTHQGPTVVNEGLLELNKIGALAISAGSLTVGDGVGGSNADVVRSTGGGSQLAQTLPVILNSSGLLDLNGNHEAIGSVTGLGSVALGTAELEVGWNNTDFTFDGVVTGSGSLRKQGTATATLTGTNLLTGSVIAQSGTLAVNGYQPQSPASVMTNGTLRGSGTVGNLVAWGAVAPGPGTLTCSNLTLGTNAVLSIQLRGTNDSSWDQLNVRGAVQLTKVTLALQTAFTNTVHTNDHFVLINNDVSDPVTGIFNGLPEGATLRQGTIHLPTQLRRLERQRRRPDRLSARARDAPGPGGHGRQPASGAELEQLARGQHLPGQAQHRQRRALHLGGQQSHRHGLHEYQPDGRDDLLLRRLGGERRGGKRQLGPGQRRALYGAVHRPPAGGSNGGGGPERQLCRGGQRHRAAGLPMVL